METLKQRYDRINRENAELDKIWTKEADLIINYTTGSRIGWMKRKGTKVSKETRLKLSEAGTRRKHSEETKRKIGLGNKNKVISLESIEKAKVTTNKRKEKGEINPGRKGLPTSDVTKKKLRDINLGKKQSRETIEKRMSKIRGRKLSKDHIKIMSDRNKKEISIGGVIYPSNMEAAKILNISSALVTKRTKSTDIKWKDWFYLDGPKS